MPVEVQGLKAEVDKCDPEWEARLDTSSPRLHCLVVTGIWLRNLWHLHVVQPLTSPKQPLTPVLLCPQSWGSHKWHPSSDSTPCFESPQSKSASTTGKNSNGVAANVFWWLKVISTFQEA